MWLSVGDKKEMTNIILVFWKWPILCVNWQRQPFYVHQLVIKTLSFTGFLAMLYLILPLLFWSVTTYLSCGLILSSWVLYSTIVQFMLFCRILLEYKIILVTLSCSCNLKLCPIADYSVNFRKEQEGRFRPLKSNISLANMTGSGYFIYRFSASDWISNTERNILNMQVSFLKAQKVGFVGCRLKAHTRFWWSHVLAIWPLVATFL